MKKIISAFLSIPLLLIGCTNSSEYDYSSFLTGDKAKVWDVVILKNKKTTKFPIHGFYFDVDGRWVEFYYSRKTPIGEKKRVSKTDIEFPEKWELKSNDSILIGSSTFSIEILNSDTIKLIGGISNNLFLLSKSKDQNLWGLPEK